MKRMIVVGTALAAALTCSAYASQQGSGGYASQSNKDKDKEVTVTGCLTSGSPASATTGTSGSTATPASPSFILTNAVIGSAPSPATSSSAAGATGTSGTTSPSGPSYSLIGGEKSELESFVNSKVEIKGTLDKPSAAADAPMPGTSAAAKQQLHVTSVKQVASTCSGQ